MSDNKECWYCKSTPHGDTSNIGTQTFSDGAISNIKLNPLNTRLLTTNTWNIPDKGANSYRLFVKINYCPMCGKNLSE